ncbi:MAG: isoprenylcysteine carboxylmethyltransferase family protein [Gemmatimonadota bacterium]|nr:isoprenylcysteine carboxylmethyltransferase family protein [Gemmatimonadota bacterium]
MESETSERPEDAAGVRFFPPGVPLAAVLAGLGLQWMWPLPAAFFPAAPLRYWVGGAMVAGAILGLGLWSVILFRRSGQNENPWKPTPSIVERGPFRVTRNPMYLQMVLSCIGLSVAFANPWILLLTPVCALLLQTLAIIPDEAYLERKFGGTYLEYKSRVRRWL